MSTSVMGAAWPGRAGAAGVCAAVEGVEKGTADAPSLRKTDEWCEEERQVARKTTRWPAGWYGGRRGARREAYMRWRASSLSRSYRSPSLAAAVACSFRTKDASTTLVALSATSVSGEAHERTSVSARSMLNGDGVWLGR